MPSLKLTLDYMDGRALDLAEGLQQPRLTYAYRSAINATLKNLNTRGAKIIRLKSSIPSKDVKKNLRVKKATASSLSGTLTGWGQPMPLNRFKLRKSAKGHTATVWGGKQKFTGSFAGPGGHVYHRVGKNRLPIKKLYGPGVAQVMGQHEVMDELEDFANERLTANTIRQLERAAHGRGR